MDDDVLYPGPTGAHLLSRAAAAGVAVGFLGLMTGWVTGQTSTVVISAVWMLAWVATIVLALRFVRRRAGLAQPTSKNDSLR